MKSPMIADLAPGQSVTGLFLVQSKDVRQKKTGEPYLSLVFVDRSGEVDAKMWDNVPEVVETFDRDDFVRVKGETQLYQNRLQITVHRLVRIDSAEVDLADFLPASRRDPEEMFAELRSVIAAMKNPHLRALLDAIFADTAVAEAYKRAPAAKTIHHAWLGGLLEHVLSLVKLARFAAAHYDAIDEDLLMTGVVLHDIGKIRELSYQRTFGYTTEGQLLGHIQIALRLIGDKIAQIAGFPPKLRNLVEHLVLSHHGQLEFGSPKVPLLPEALLLHHLDNMDSKMEAMRGALERDRSSTGEWTPYVPALERNVLDRRKYLEAQPPAPKTAPAPKPSAPRASTTLGEKFQALGELFPEGK
jgi:3'-5' exoribonuclease